MGQLELCALVPGLTQQNLSNMEARDSKTSEYAVRIADALRVPIRWLLDGEGNSEYSGDALEIAAIYDALDAAGKRVMRANANALLPEHEPAGFTRAAGTLLSLPTPRPAAAIEKIDASLPAPPSAGNGPEKGPRIRG